MLYADTNDLSDLTEFLIVLMCDSQTALRQFWLEDYIEPFNEQNPLNLL